MTGKLIIFSAPSGSGKIYYNQLSADAELEFSVFYFCYQPSSAWNGAAWG